MSVLHWPFLWLGRALWAFGACFCWAGMWLMEDEEPEEGDDDGWEVIAEWLDEDEEEDE